MHGREGEERKRRPHMWPVPAPGTALSASSAAHPPPPPTLAQPDNASSESDSPLSSRDSFLKDGRKIRVGDCALFQAGNAPPFIGIIRWFTKGKEDYLKLCVNWLYRPADVKLAKDVLLEAAPNEIFYSFHKDVIPAASLLHPCKVAFLRKGVELPAGISSFVCRRVYDITNKCLWWLTDQDYINERQDEVNQLLDKTRLEMHATIQSGERSPKSHNSPTSTQQLKSVSDSVHNTGFSLPSQTKGKRKDRSDQGTEHIKRERSFPKPDDGDSASFKCENMIKAEIVKITEKGGLVTTEGVEKLLNLMQLDRTEKKIDVAGRVLVADVIAATDRYDCLGRFVQLRGVPILDDWLQEVRKPKAGDGSSPKESDKAVEELLLALLRALAKLPVNLNALQTCNIGKSVNNLRNHKNSEIQKKARSLIDIWKKRVDAEITKTDDAKSVAPSQPVWQVKPGSSDISNAGNRRAGSTEVGVKSPATQTASCKIMPGKPGTSDAVVKSSSVTQGSLKKGSTLTTSTAVVLKDPLFKAAANIGSAEMPPTAGKEEKSSSLSQAQNNSQTCSTDRAKVGTSLKEDTRNSSAGSINAAKAVGSSRHRRSSNGASGTSSSGVQKETNLGKSGSLNKTTTLEKSSLSGLTCDKPIDTPAVDSGNNQRLILRLPNPAQSPAQSASGGSFEDPSISGSRASSPGVSDKHEYNDRRTKVKGDVCPNTATDANTESWQSNDVKELAVGAGGFISPAVDEEHVGTTEDTGKAAEAPIAACSSSGNDRGVFLTEPRTRGSFSSINALIESCVKYSEANTPLVVDDDIGMNLLASVAAGEMTTSDLISPTSSPGTSPVTEDPSTEAKPRLPSDDAAQSHFESDEVVVADSNKQENSVASILTKDASYQDGANFSGDNGIAVPLQDNKLISGHAEKSFAALSPKTEDYYATSELKLEGERDRHFSMSKPVKREKQDNDRAFQLEEQRLTDEKVLDCHTDCKLKERGLSADGSMHVECAYQTIGDGNPCNSEIACKNGCDFDLSSSGINTEKLVVEESQICTTGKETTEVVTSSDQQQLLITDDRSGDAVMSSHDVPCPENADESRTCVPGNIGGSHLESNDKQVDNSLNPSNLDESARPATASDTAGVEDLKVTEAHETSPVGSTSQEPPSSCTNQDTGYQSEAAGSRLSMGLASQETPLCCMNQDTENQSKPAGCRLSGIVGDGREDLASSLEASLLAVIADSDVASKLDFDLNEGIPGDDGNNGETAVSVATFCSTAIDLPCLSPFANPMSNVSPAPITVAAPAKGAFVPPENLLKSKDEPGWKGSAATSAFRPAEPRKVLEMPPSSPDMPPSDSAGKECRAPLNFDLNEPDEGVLEDMTMQSFSKTTGFELGTESNLDVPPQISGGLDLDLNRTDEGTENGQFLASSSHRLEVPLLTVGPALTVLPSREANMLRDFDLNNGPIPDEVSAESITRSQNIKNISSMPFLFPVSSIRTNAAELGSVSSWFPPGSSYPAVAIPSLTNREQPYPIVAAPGTQRILGPITASGPFGGDVHRGAVLSSSPAMAFTPAAAFPYAGFTYGSNFPLASTSFSGAPTTFVDSSSGAGSSFPAIPSPLVGPAGTVLSNYRRPYTMSFPEGSTSGGSDNTRKWITPSLDLNAGPGNADIDGSSWASRQLLVTTSQAFTEEQVRMYTVPGGGLKRKEPEGGWDADRSAYKQLSWQ
ncbi:uncharacterized protein LOC103986874 isoform X1 [Musa acuminata AAA Group]|uniref:uncharacterized protein LOC103986874 isoform X1 n=1 Tax=Musa acuminata AAA Group TaxID=214697 RepID=UPI0031D2ECF9